jgi:hypothetical protein
MHFVLTEKLTFHNSQKKKKKTLEIIKNYENSNSQLTLNFVKFFAHKKLKFD